MAELPEYKRAFIDLMLECGVLRFGEFTTKSGRQTPYFINAGLFNTGAAASQLGQFYAAAIIDQFGKSFDNLYGPAYKGIPLAALTAAALYQEHSCNVSYTFNRKEQKDHGEGGNLVGYKYQGGEKVLIIEDVVTAGVSVRESIPIIQSAAENMQLMGLIVSVDRMEKGQGDQSALQELSAEFDMQAVSIVNLDELIDYLSGSEGEAQAVLDEACLRRINEYRAKYGIRSES